MNILYNKRYINFIIISIIIIIIIINQSTYTHFCQLVSKFSFVPFVRPSGNNIPRLKARPKPLIYPLIIIVNMIMIFCVP